MRHDWTVSLIRWETYASTAPFVLFVVMYGLRSRWWVSRVGRSIMLLAVSLTSILLLALAARAFGSGYRGQRAYQVVVYSSLPVAGWFLLLTLLKVQRDGAREVRRLRRKAR